MSTYMFQRGLAPPMNYCLPKPVQPPPQAFQYPQYPFYGYPPQSYQMMQDMLNPACNPENLGVCGEDNGYAFPVPLCTERVPGSGCRREEGRNMCVPQPTGEDPRMLNFCRDQRLSSQPQMQPHNYIGMHPLRNYQYCVGNNMETKQQTGERPMFRVEVDAGYYARLYAA